MANSNSTTEEKTKNGNLIDKVAESAMEENDIDYENIVSNGNIERDELTQLSQKTKKLDLDEESNDCLLSQLENDSISVTETDKANNIGELTDKGENVNEKKESLEPTSTIPNQADKDKHIIVHGADHDDKSDEEETSVEQNGAPIANEQKIRDINEDVQTGHGNAAVMHPALNFETDNGAAREVQDLQDVASEDEAHKGSQNIKAETVKDDVYDEIEETAIRNEVNVTTGHDSLSQPKGGSGQADKEDKGTDAGIEAETDEDQNVNRADLEEKKMEDTKDSGFVSDEIEQDTNSNSAVGPTLVDAGSATQEKADEESTARRTSEDAKAIVERTPQVKEETITSVNGDAAPKSHRNVSLGASDVVDSSVELSTDEDVDDEMIRGDQIHVQDVKEDEDKDENGGMASESDSYDDNDKRKIPIEEDNKPGKEKTENHEGLLDSESTVEEEKDQTDDSGDEPVKDTAKVEIDSLRNTDDSPKKDAETEKDVNPIVQVEEVNEEEEDTAVYGSVEDGEEETEESGDSEEDEEESGESEESEDESDEESESEQPPIFLYTSLTAGGYHVMSDTNRLATILKANDIEFTMVDLATNERAKRIWKWRSNGRKLPAVVRDDEIVGDYKEIEEANEMAEVRQLVLEED